VGRGIVMEREWNRDLPEKEGWYYWKARKVNSDEFYYQPWFVCDESGGEYVTFWEGGTEMNPPKNGFWSPVDLPVDKEIQSLRNLLKEIRKECRDDESLGYHKWVIATINRKLGDFG
jgi:hypothetical protein